MRKHKLLAGVLGMAMVLGGMALPKIGTENVLTAEAVSDDAEYHAYLYFMTGAYSFRLPWDNEYYGLYGSENTDEFTYDTVQADWGTTSAPGTFVDATITGDGMYTVSVSGLVWDEDEFLHSENAYILLGVSTDIPWYGADIEVNSVVIGDTMFENPDVYNEGTDGESAYVLADVEYWSDDVSLGEYDPISSDISITFTISGLSSALSAEQDTSTVTEADVLTPELSYNAGDQNYSTYGDVVNSYLVGVDDGYMRVEYNGSYIVVEYYDAKYNLTSKLYVEVELPLFGGFYAGEDAYYLVFGQTNYEEDDETEVIRVVKYSTSWERQGQASLCGANTVHPFDFGSLRMTEYNGFLYIRTCHVMYASSDGLNHQANLTVVVDEAYMEVANYKNDGYYGIGYTSHSFNQFILVDDEGYIVAADHGDAYPRAATLLKTYIKAGTPKTDTSHDRVNLLSFAGETGANYTGASIGGLEYSSTSYLLVGNSVDQDEDYSTHTARNIFVGMVSRDDISDTGITVNWITDYDTDGDTTTSTPQLVKVGDDSFILLWTVSGYDSSNKYVTKLNYVFLDGEGNTSSKIYEVDGRLSDCQPIFTGSEVVWYVTGNADASYGSSKPYFYSIDLEGNYSVLNVDDGDVNLDGKVDYLDAMMALRYDAELVDLTYLQLSLGDVNNDGEINSLDAILMLRYDAGLIDNF